MVSAEHSGDKGCFITIYIYVILPAKNLSAGSAYIIIIVCTVLPTSYLNATYTYAFITGVCEDDFYSFLFLALRHKTTSIVIVNVHVMYNITIILLWYTRQRYEREKINVSILIINIVIYSKPILQCLNSAELIFMRYSAYYILVEHSFARYAYCSTL